MQHHAGVQCSQCSKNDLPYRLIKQEISQQKAADGETITGKDSKYVLIKNILCTTKTNEGFYRKQGPLVCEELNQRVRYFPSIRISLDQNNAKKIKINYK